MLLPRYELVKLSYVHFLQIECDEDEDPEGVFKRFRNSCNQAGMVYEVYSLCAPFIGSEDVLALLLSFKIRINQDVRTWLHP